MKHNYKQKLKRLSNVYMVREQDLLNIALKELFDLRPYTVINLIYNYFEDEFNIDYAATWHDKYKKKY